MPKRKTEFFLVDVLTAIFKTLEYSADFDTGDQLLCDSRSFDAVMRELQIIGEAVNNILADDTLRDLSPKYFRQVVNFRNMITHEYFGVDIDEVWDIVQNKLAPLRIDILALLDICDPTAFKGTVAYAITDNEKIRHFSVAAYLKTLL